MRPLRKPQQHGQSVWLDFLARDFIEKGKLAALVERDGVRGVTSNPSIFEKAIAAGDEYDAAFERLLKDGDRLVTGLYEAVAIEDIQNAADVLRPVHDGPSGRDGYVSIEVSPYLAHDTGGTIAEARRLWAAIGHDNLMVKVPGTPEGLPAIEELTAQGLNINITLLFSQDVYKQVLEAYLSGLERFAASGGDLSRVASVASFFVSRIDTEADRRLDEKIAATEDADRKARLSALEGKVAIANVKLVYQHYGAVIASDRWKALEAKSARVQRLLWASTSTKNKAYRDVLYIEELIGRKTVNTVPPATLDAFRDHGRVRDTLEEDIPAAEAVLSALAGAGISLDAITGKLLADGVRLFPEAFDKLLAAVAAKRARMLDGRLDGQALALGGDLTQAVEALTEDWRAADKGRRLWRRDASLWTGHDEGEWLGWLDAVAREDGALPRYRQLADAVRRAAFTDAVGLGMGGSSLGPEVLATTFGQGVGFPKLHILDSTVPTQVRRMEDAITPGRTLFIVSSKSGSTTEPNVLMQYFFGRLKDTAGGEPGAQFIAATDPGSLLEEAARERGFMQVFHGEPSIGGRYSVISPFGLVPAAVAGIDLRAFLDTARVMVHSCGGDVPPQENPGIQLGLALGAAAHAGRDKVTLSVSEGIDDFGAWAEQLFAESTGKNGKALIPVAGEPLGRPEVYGSDRVFVDLALNGDSAREAALAALEEAGHPVIRITVTDICHLGQEFFRFELATAVAGSVMGLNPFDQPDVEAAKVKTRDLTAAYEKEGALPPESPRLTEDDLAVYADEANAEALRRAGAGDSVASWLQAHLARVAAGDYVALLAYLDRNDADTAALQTARLAIRDARRVATCLGFGPRFQHSTGQAYKGGPNTGVFVQITADDVDDPPVPGERVSFGVIKAAQARGDFDVLAERGRRALRLQIRGDIAKGLAAIDAAARQALS